MQRFYSDLGEFSLKRQLRLLLYVFAAAWSVNGRAPPVSVRMKVPPGTRGGARRKEPVSRTAV